MYSDDRLKSGLKNNVLKIDLNRCRRIFSTKYLNFYWEMLSDTRSRGKTGGHSFNPDFSNPYYFIS